MRALPSAESKPPAARFEEVLAAAVCRKGSLEAVESALSKTPVRSVEAIASTPDDRILAAMSRQVFAAGLSARLIEARWSAFEHSFARFQPGYCASIRDEGIERLMRNERIVRNRAKIEALRTNACLIGELQRRGGTAAAVIAKWPDSDYIGLLRLLRDHGARLGGDSGPRFLRAIGKSSFILTRDVCAALAERGIVSGFPARQWEWPSIQSVFNCWSVESGRNLTELSRILAMSVANASDVRAGSKL